MKTTKMKVSESPARNMEEQDKFETIDDHKIRYQKHGSGPEPMLLIHGAVGSLNDFKLQVDQKEGLSLDRFTLVLLDLPGFGKSSPELQDTKFCDPTLEYFEVCAKLAAKLMANLGFKRYSLAAWSDGARVACLMAIKNQSRVNSLTIWSFLPQMESQSSWALARTRDINTWNEEALSFYTNVYGEQQFSDKWRKYVDYLVCALEQRNHQLFDIRSKLSQIKCPTMILHGSADPIVNYTKQVEPLEYLIHDSTISQFSGSAHNLHQANPAKFNQVLTNFVTGIGVC